MRLARHQLPHGCVAKGCVIGGGLAGGQYLIHYPADHAFLQWLGFQQQLGHQAIR